MTCRKAKIPKLTIPTVVKDIEQHELYLLVGMQTGTLTLEGSSSVFFTKPNISLTNNPTTTFLGIYKTDLKDHMYPKPGMQMFVAVVLIIVPNWKQPVGKQTLIHPYMEYYPAITRNGLLSHTICG